MVHFSLRHGLEQPKPLAQLQSLLTDGQLQGHLPPPGPARLDAGPWLIGVGELQAMGRALAEAGYPLERLISAEPLTRVAAASIGLRWEAGSESNPVDVSAAAAKSLPAVPPMAGVSGGDTRADTRADTDAAEPSTPVPLKIHQGTLRSGDVLETEGSALVLGDVNPGARVVAGGHVLVWGTLRGVAHAGCHGETGARIVALQLRPLQLRIAAAVARGPEELPPAGYAEQAELVDGVIAINPAAPQWPCLAS